MPSNFCIIKYELRKEDVLLGKLVNLLRPFSKSLTLLSRNYNGPIGTGTQDMHPPSDGKRAFWSSNKYLKLVFLQLKIGINLARLKPRPEFVVLFTATSTLAFPMLIARIINSKTIKFITGGEKTPIRNSRGQYQIFWSLTTNLLKRATLMLANRIVVESPSILSAYGMKNTLNVHVIPLYVDTEEFRCINPFTERHKIVGYVGRLSRDKGVMNLVNAIPKVLDQLDDVRFVFVGEDLSKGEIERYVRGNNLGEAVDLVGWVHHDQIPSFLNEFRLLILPSFSEGLPNVLLEAMACGTPVLASPVGGVVDLIEDGHSGFILRENSPKGIAESILRLLSNPGLEEVGMRANEAILKGYSYSMSVSKWRQLVGELESCHH